MSDENATKPRKGMLLKIVIPVLILCIIAGIWIIKKNSNPGSGDNSDFALLVTEKIDLEKLKSYGVPIVIDFGSDSCIPCKAMAPVLKELNADLQGKAIIRFVDVWKYQGLAEGYPISVIPTQIFIDSSGKPYAPKGTESIEMKQYASKDKGELAFTTHEGGVTKEQLLSILNEMGLKQ